MLSMSLKVQMPAIVLNEQPNNNVQNDHVLILRAEAQAIDAYFADRDMPLAGLGMKMAEEADKNGLDWRLLPAIAVRESTGGKNDCKNVSYNAFGWGSCRIGFDSNEEAIETIAKHLGGNDPSTERFYAGKSTKEILKKYNPPHIAPRYVPQVLSIMNAIGEKNMATQDTPESSSDLLAQKG